MMKFRKGDNTTRFHDPIECYRHPVPDHPEMLCEYDITIWRENGVGFYHRRGNNARDGDIPDSYTALIRHGDTHGMTRDVNSRTKDMKYIGEVIHRVVA